MSNGAYEKPHLIYDHTTKKLKLQTNSLIRGQSSETSITLLNSFNNIQVAFWLTKKGTGGILSVVKASISNYSSTLTLNSALASQSIDQSINQFINVNTWDGVAPIIRASGSCIKHMTIKILSQYRYNTLE